MPGWAWILVVLAVVLAAAWLYDRRNRRRHIGDGGSRNPQDRVDWEPYRQGIQDWGSMGGGGGN